MGHTSYNIPMKVALVRVTTIISFLLIVSSFWMQSFASACEQVNNGNCFGAEEIQGFRLEESYCMSGCNQGAEPGYYRSIQDGCSASPFPTVWYTLKHETIDCFIDLEFSSTYIGLPTVAIYNGDCSSINLISCDQGHNGNLKLSGIALNQDLLIAISSADGSVGEFDFCIMVTPNENVCNTDNKLEVVSTNMGSALAGPYKPGETVEVCYTIDGYNNLGCNFLHAIIPMFGNGWDSASFDSNGQPLNITQQLVTQGITDFSPEVNISCHESPAGSWEWFPEGTVAYKLNSQNPLGLVASDQIPAAWVFVNSFDPSCFIMDESCCSNPTNDPNAGYGDHNYPLCWPDDEQQWKVCFELTATTNADCQDRSDCSVAFKTLSDGELGTYTDLNCQADQLSYLNASVLCCESPSLQVDQSTYSICKGDEFELEVDINDGSSTLFWMIDGNADIFYDLENNGKIISSNLESGTHMFEVYATNGCMSEPLLLEVQVDEPIQATIVQEPSMACEGEEITLELTSFSDLTSTEIIWNNDPALDDALVNVDNYSDPYIVSIESGACNTILEHILQVGESPTLDQEEDKMITCTDFLFEIQANPSDATQALDYSWEKDGQNLSNEKSILVDEEGEYIVEVLDASSGCSTSDTIIVHPNPSSLDVELLQGQEIEVTSGSSVELDLVINIEASELSSIRWFHDGSLDCDDCLSTMAFPVTDVQYIVEVTDIYGCSETIEVSIRLLDEQAAGGIYIPNVFSPEMAGENGYFRIFDNGAIEKVYKFSIYNRWGENVHCIEDFKTDDQRSVWNGMAKGDYLDPGVYMYMIDYKLVDGDREQKIGHVTLLK